MTSLLHYTPVRHGDVEARGLLHNDGGAGKRGDLHLVLPLCAYYVGHAFGESWREARDDTAHR